MEPRGSEAASASSSARWGGRAWGVQNCYLDYAPLVIKNPGNTLVTDNLFLGSSSIVLEATTGDFDVRGVVITSNSHHTGNTGNASIILDERHGNFASVTDVVVENNQVDATDAAQGKRSTRATMSTSLWVGATTGVLYFADHLIFTTPIDAVGAC